MRHLVLLLAFVAGGCSFVETFNAAKSQEASASSGSGSTATSASSASSGSTATSASSGSTETTGSTTGASSSGSTASSASSSSTGTSASGTSSGGTSNGSTTASSASGSTGRTGSSGTTGCVPSGPEVCDGVDNDCDGRIDQYPDGGPLLGAEPCYTFDAGTPGTGVCQTGVETCQGGGWVCLGEVGPSPEVCDGQDNDCNGAKDDGIDVGSSCTVSGQQGACAAGAPVCSGSSGITCTQTVFPASEVCDGVDNDCDGRTDQYSDGGPLLNGSCYDFDPTTENKGACKAGVLTCSNRRFVCEGEVGPSTEICWNDVDENCDGQLDEGCTAPITGFTPASGGAGSTVVLLGENFPPSPTVTWLGSNVGLTVLSSTANRILAQIPAGTSPGFGPFAVAYKGSVVGTSSQSFHVTASSTGLVQAGTVTLVGEPYALALGDLNRDGIPDALVSFFFPGYADGGLDVLPGRSDGGFGPAVMVDKLYAASSAVGIADLNGDGWADAYAVDASISGAPHTVDVLLNRGDGGLGAASEYTVGIQTVSASVGDLNGDGAQDLLVVTANSASATPVFGLGDGGFTSGTPASLSSSPAVNWASLADMNEDGILDELTGDYRSSVGIAQGIGDGTFGYRNVSAVSGYHVYMIAVADVNGDGHLDVISAENSDANAGYVSVYFGDGAGNLSSVASYPVSTSQVSKLAVADLNGDGYPDVVTVAAGYSLIVLDGSADGSFQDGGVYSTGSSIPELLDVGDMNRDDKPDVVVGTLEGQLLVFLAQ